MPRALLALAVFLASLAAPAVAAACCADIERRAPLGWSADGELLVGATSSTDCVGTYVAEVHAPGDLAARARFDLYGGGRRLGPGAVPRELSDDEIYDMDDRGEPVAFEVPTAVARRFPQPVRSLCADDVLVVGVTDPSDPLDTAHWESHVVLTVALRSNDGFVEVAELRVRRFIAEEGRILLHPAPNGRRGLLRLSVDGAEFAGDELHWLELPSGAPSVRADCAFSTVVIPAPDNLAEPGIEEGNWHADAVPGLRRDLEAESDPREAARLKGYVVESFARALWADPANPMLRASLIESLESAGRTDVAAEVAGAFPVAEALPSAALPVELFDDAGAPLSPPTYDSPGASAAPPSCDAAAGGGHTWAILIPVFVFVGGLSLSKLRRRRRRSGDRSDPLG